MLHRENSNDPLLISDGDGINIQYTLKVFLSCLGSIDIDVMYLIRYITCT